LPSALIETHNPSAAFPHFTRDLHALADWLQQCGIRSVAMESTSVYWIPIYQILEARGLEVYLVNAQHVKNVPGRKTDVSDCQWLQYLHSVGLLRASFRPPGFICAMRSLWRHRGSLIQMAAEHVLHMQKALDQMNLQIHRVLNDITGVSGLRILDAILAGERDPAHTGSALPRRREEQRGHIAKSLEGDYRPEHLFALRQSLAAFRYYQQLVLEADQEIQRQLANWKTAATPSQRCRSERKVCHINATTSREHSTFAGELYRIFGVDLTNVPGISAITAQTILCEIGTDVSRFRNASAFASWLGLCPEKKISGGKGALHQEPTRPKPGCHRPSHGAQSYTTPKTIWESSSGGSVASSASLRRSQPRPTSSLESSTTCSAHERHMTNRCSTSAKKRH
jgi:transposase